MFVVFVVTLQPADISIMWWYYSDFIILSSLWAQLSLLKATLFYAFVEVEAPLEVKPMLVCNNLMDAESKWELDIMVIKLLNLASDVSCILLFVVKLAICKPSQFCVKWLQIRS